MDFIPEMDLTTKTDEIYIFSVRVARSHIGILFAINGVTAGGCISSFGCSTSLTNSQVFLNLDEQIYKSQDILFFYGYK